MPSPTAFIASFLFVVCFGHVPDEQRLLEVLLKEYNTGARPVFNASHIVSAKFGLTLIQISDMVSSFISILKVFFSVVCEEQIKKIPDEQRLLENILDNYNTAARPVFNASRNVTVSFGMTLIHISDMVRYL